MRPNIEKNKPKKKKSSEEEQDLTLMERNKEALKILKRENMVPHETENANENQNANQNTKIWPLLLADIGWKNMDDNAVSCCRHGPKQHAGSIQLAIGTRG